MPPPAAIRRIVLGSAAGAGVALLAVSFHGMAGLDTRLAAAAQARDAAQTRMVVQRSADAPERDCDKRERADSAEPVVPPDSRDY